MNNYDWEKEFNEKLKNQIKSKVMLRDIPISGEELRQMKKIVSFNLKNDYFQDEKENLLLARYLVELGYRKYDEKNYWDFVFEDLNLNRTGKLYNILCDLFLRTMKANNLITCSTGKKNVATVLINTYVPQNYLENFYKFLEIFYTKELAQTFEKELVLEEIRELQDYLENEKDINDKYDNKFTDKPTTYHLIKPVKMSMYLNKKSFEEYLYNYLEVFDSYWWNDDEKKKLKFFKETKIFEEWFTYEVYKQDRKKGKYREVLYRKPTIKLREDNKLILYIPRQKINMEDYRNGLYYKIRQNNKIVSEGSLSHFVSSGKILTEQEKIILDKMYYNSKLTIESGGVILNSFDLFETPFLIFNLNRDQEQLKSLKDGEEYFIYSTEELILNKDNEEETLLPILNEFTYKKESNYNIQLEERKFYLNDIPEYEILDNFEKTVALKNNEKIKVYKKLPKIFIKTNQDLDMLKVDFNEERYRLSVISDIISKTSEGLILDLDKYFEDFKGYSKIRISDLVTEKQLFYKEIFVVDTKIVYDKEIYFFEDEITLDFIDKDIIHNYENIEARIKVPTNKYEVKFEYNNYKLSQEIPIFRWKLKKDEIWNHKELTFWYEDFKGELEMIIPNTKEAKLKLNDIRVIQGKKIKGSFAFELNRFLDIFINDLEKEYELKLIYGSEEITIGKIIGKVFVENVAIGFQQNSQILLGQFDFYGKGSYFIDIIDKKQNHERIIIKQTNDICSKILINKKYSLRNLNHDIEIGYFIEKKNRFSKNIHKEEVLYKGKLRASEDEKEEYELLFREDIIRVEKCYVGGKSFLVNSFYIKNIEKDGDVYKGQAFYYLKDKSYRYFNTSNPFEFKVENFGNNSGIVYDLLGNDEESPILDSYKHRLITGDPQEDSKNYERWLIPEKYRFKIIGGK